MSASADMRARLLSGDGQGLVPIAIALEMHAAGMLAWAPRPHRHATGHAFVRTS